MLMLFCINCNITYYIIKTHKKTNIKKKSDGVPAKKGLQQNSGVFARLTPNPFVSYLKFVCVASTVLFVSMAFLIQKAQLPNYSNSNHGSSSCFLFLGEKKKNNKKKKNKKKRSEISVPLLLMLLFHPPLQKIPA